MPLSWLNVGVEVFLPPHDMMLFDKICDTEHIFIFKLVVGID